MIMVSPINVSLYTLIQKGEGLIQSRIPKSILDTSWLKRPKAVLISSDHGASPHILEELGLFFWPKLFPFFTVLTKS